MNIAQIAAPYEAGLPKLYGGTDRVVASLCGALTGLGHEVIDCSMRSDCPQPASGAARGCQLEE